MFNNPESMLCECGWLNYRKKSDAVPNKPLDKCEACGKEGKPSRVLDNINLVLIGAEERERRICEHAKSHNLRVVQLSKNRWIVVVEGGYASFSIGTNGQGGGRAYVELKILNGPADWKGTTDYLRANTPELPQYLINK